MISEELVSKALSSCGILFKSQLILKGLLGVFKSTNLFLEARAEILTKFSLVFWSIWRQQKDISKLTDLYLFEFHKGRHQQKWIHLLFYTIWQVYLLSWLATMTAYSQRYPELNLKRRRILLFRGQNYRHWANLQYSTGL